MEWFAVVEAGGGALSVHEDRNMLQWRDCGGAVVASFSLTAEQKEIVYYARSLIVDPLQ
jgi:hypothetical protein